MINTDHKHITNRPFTYTANLISSMYRYSFFKHRRGPGMEEADTVAALLSFAAITNCSTSIRWHSSETLCWPKQRPVVLACRRPTGYYANPISVFSVIDDSRKRRQCKERRTDNGWTVSGRNDAPLWFEVENLPGTLCKASLWLSCRTEGQFQIKTKPDIDFQSLCLEYTLYLPLGKRKRSLGDR